MTDHLTDHAQRFILDESDIRGEIVHLKQSYREILDKHQYPQHVGRVLGEVLLAAVLLTSTIKLKGDLTIQLQGKGAVKLLVAKCTHDLKIRGLAQWDEAASPETFKRAFGNGQLIITISPQHSTQFYQSIVPLNHQSVTQAIEHYFTQSEQLTTRLWLMVDDESAAGLLLQLLPGSQADERMTQWYDAVHRASLIEVKELKANDNLALLDRLYPEEDLRIFAEREVKFECTCTIERMKKAIVTLGEQEANAVLSTQKEIVVTCEFCSQSYGFDKIDVAHIFSERKDRSLH